MGIYMIRKIFKTILIYFICFGITVPSNAAISVSDGSAFMTKTEFMADINNLSGRVAQLETTLDGTLDGKVSSYLEQKGFWKAKIQTLNQSSVTGVTPASVNRLSDNTAKGKAVLTGSNNLELVTNVTASGMALLNLAYKGHTASTGADSKISRWGYWGTKTGSYYFQANLMLVAHFFEKTNGIETQKASLVLGSNLGQMRQNETSINYYLNVIYLPVKELLIPTMFFVYEGSSITWHLEESYGFGELSGNPTISNGSNLGDTIDVYIRDFVVY